MPFKSLGIIEPILRALKEEGYTTPTPIQVQAIPIVMEGKDLLGVAQTGTGKTAAFAIPIIQRLSDPRLRAERPHGRRMPIRSLVLTPTRELAIQIDESFKAYGRHVGLSSVVIFGGVKQGQQTLALKRGVDIVIATPGRLLDLMQQRYVDLRDVEIFVLDEADRMLDMGFIRDIEKIITALPKKRQSLFFSATMPPPIVKLAHEIVHSPIKVEVAPVAATVDLIHQVLYHVEKSKKKDLLLHLLEDRDIKTALVFTRTKHGADAVVKLLTKNNITAEAIHGNKAQNARQRALGNFKDQRTRVLVATDIAARGIDVDDLEYVINYEIPNVPETYIHRIGRTGRAGARGTAFSFCSPDEKAYLRDIEKLIGKRIPVAHDHAFAKADHAELNYASHSHESRSNAQLSHRVPAEDRTPRRDRGRNEHEERPQLQLRIAKPSHESNLHSRHPKPSVERSKPAERHPRPQLAKPRQHHDARSEQQPAKPKSSGKKVDHGRHRRRPSRA